MKKLQCVILSLLFIIAGLSACASETATYPLTVNSTPINEEIFKYYLDIAYAEAGLLTREERVTYATQQCIRYVALNSVFTQWGLSLSAAEKAETAERANALWSIFREHYENIGVSKETFMKIQTSRTYTESLRYALFDKDGRKPIADEILRGYFVENYVAVKLVQGYLFDTDVYGNRVEYTEEALQGILERYNNAVEQINGGVAIDFMYASLINSGSEEVSQALKTEIVPAGDPTFPEGFFEAVQNISEGRAGLAVFGDYLYLVYRVSILSDPQFFEDYRSECLLAVSEPYLQNEISEFVSGYTSVRKAAAVEKCCEQVERARKS